MFKVITFFAALLLVAQASVADILKGPCGAVIACPPTAGKSAQKLQDAFLSPMTTPEQRDKIVELSAPVETGTSVGWDKVADTYFAWRARELAYRNPSHDETIPYKTVEPNWAHMRVVGEAALRARLIDPDSAQFNWPNGFFNGSWKPFLSKRVEGYVTCGAINARNRMGGYTGSSAFVVVIQNESVVYIDLDEGTDRFGMVAASCAKSAGMFPRPQVGMLSEPKNVKVKVRSDFSVADELSKLATLKDKGLLSQSEFDAQKAVLLTRD